jgi:hypothetical protein
MKTIRSLFTVLGTLACVYSAQAAAITEIEGNDTLGTAQNVTGSFSIGANADIGSQWFIDPTATPWVGITSNGGTSYDYYSFTTATFGTISLDIDYGYNHGGSVDTEIGLWRSNGAGSFTLISFLDDTNVTATAIPGVVIGFDGWNRGPDPGSTHSYDPGLRFRDMAAGTYVVGVGKYNTAFSNTGMTGVVLDSAATYTLQITANAGSVPDSGSTAVLIGLALAGLTAARRKRA